MLRDDDDTATLAARVADALSSGDLAVAELTARHLGGFLGKTSSVLYRRFGSLDGFLHEVAQEGFRRLATELEHAAAGGDLADLAASFIAFGLDRPALYYVMFEHRYDWHALRRAGAMDRPMAGLALWERLIAGLKAAGSSTPSTDVRLLYAGLHGLVSLASAGRANVGELATSDRDIALSSARTLADRICPRASV